MATKITVSGGQVNCVYDDRFRPILEALGMLKVERATNIEFDESTGDWVATLCSTGQEIARGPNRNDVITQEVKWLEDNPNVSHSKR